MVCEALQLVSVVRVCDVSAHCPSTNTHTHTAHTSSTYTQQQTNTHTQHTHTQHTHTQQHTHTHTQHLVSVVRVCDVSAHCPNNQGRSRGRGHPPDDSSRGCRVATLREQRLA